jgi:iron complex outermembrane recepter protein
VETHAKKNMPVRGANATISAKWWLAAPLPLGAALNGAAMAADPALKASADEEKEITLPTIKVKAARDTTSSDYKADTSSVVSMVTAKRSHYSICRY